MEGANVWGANVNQTATELYVVTLAVVASLRYSMLKLYGAAFAWVEVCSC